MDLNIVVVCGQLSTHPKIETYPNHNAQMELTVRTESPKGRTEYVHVVYTTTDDDIKSMALMRGDRIWVSGFISNSRVRAIHVQTVGDDDES